MGEYTPDYEYGVSGYVSSGTMDGEYPSGEITETVLLTGNTETSLLAEEYLHREGRNL